MLKRKPKMVRLIAKVNVDIVCQRRICYGRDVRETTGCTLFASFMRGQIRRILLIDVKKNGSFGVKSGIVVTCKRTHCVSDES